MINNFPKQLLAKDIQIPVNSAFVGDYFKLWHIRHLVLHLAGCICGSDKINYLPMVTKEHISITVAV